MHVTPEASGDHRSTEGHPKTSLALDFGGTKVAVGVSHKTGRLTQRTSFAIGAHASEVLDVAREAAGSLLGGQRPDRVVISTPGVVLDGQLQFAPNVDGWESVDLPAWASASWPSASVSLCNDVKAAAHAEATEGLLRDVDPGLYVNLGTGIAAAIIVGGRVVHGARGLAGEIGYTPSSRSLDVLDTDGSVEAFAGGVGFQRAGVRIPESPNEIWWDSSNGTAARARLDELVRLISACALLVAPQRVVLGGGMAANGAIVSYLAERLPVICPSGPEVVASRFGSDASLVGALITAENE